MAADDCRAVTHTGRSVRVNMTVVRFLEMSLTDRLKRSYSAAKDKPNSKQSCTRFKEDHNSRIIKDSQSSFYSSYLRSWKNRRAASLLGNLVHVTTLLGLNQFPRRCLIPTVWMTKRSASWRCNTSLMLTANFSRN